LGTGQAWLEAEQGLPDRAGDSFLRGAPRTAIGDKPEAEAYSLRFAGASGIPNGIEEKGGPIAASRQADKRG